MHRHVQQKRINSHCQGFRKSVYLWAKDLQWGYKMPCTKMISNIWVLLSKTKFTFIKFFLGLSAPKILQNSCTFLFSHETRQSFVIQHCAADAINPSDFSTEADIQFCSESQLYKIAILTYYLDDILGGHPTKTGLLLHTS